MHRMLVRQKEGTYCLIEWEGMHSPYVLSAIRKGIKRWVENTEEGKTAKSAVENITFETMLFYVDSLSLQAFLDIEGVKQFNINPDIEVSDCTFEESILL